MGTGTVRYTYRLRPGAVAERALLQEWGRCSTRGGRIDRYRLGRYHDRDHDRSRL